MKIFLLSDTHGKIEDAVQVIDNLVKRNIVIDLIVHLGDLVSDAKKLSTRFHIPVEQVGGNMDGTTQGNGHKIIETPYGNILLTHGHLDGAKSDPFRLTYRCQELGCKAAFFGHTHAPFVDEKEGVLLVNPGSISNPKNLEAHVNNTRSHNLITCHGITSLAHVNTEAGPLTTCPPSLVNRGTYALINIDSNEISGSILFVQAEKDSSSKIEGKLKGVFNNSDRF